MASSTCDSRRRRWVPLALAALSSVLLPVFPAAAAPSPGPDELEAKSEAQAKLVEGVSLLKDRRYVDALARFQQAYALVPSPLIAYDFGLAYLGLGDEPRALESFETFLREANGAPADKREKAERHRGELRGQVAVVELSADVGQADLTIDGAPLGHLTFPRRLYLRPGSHEVVARADGAVHAATVTCAAGQTVSLAVELARPAPASAPALSLAPPAAVPLPPSSSVALVEQRPPSVAKRARAWALSAAAIGAVSLGVGVAFGVKAMNDGAAVTAESRGHLDFTPDTETSGLRDEKLGVLFLSVGAAAVVAAIGLYAWARSRPAGGGTLPGGGP
jgi:hypothetical protein